MKHDTKIVLKAFAHFIVIVAIALGLLRLEHLSRETKKELVMPMATVINLVDSNNVRIKQWLNYWTVNPPDSGLRSFYYDKIVDIFIENGFSEDRARLYAEVPGVECGWNQLLFPSTSSARGLWQFTKGTAEQLGLNTEEGYDERLDPQKATWAAAAGFLELEQAFNHDVVKVLFAYHAGPGVLTDMRRTYRTDNAWLYDFPNRETYNFAPKVLSLALYMHRKYEQSFRVKKDTVGQYNTGR